MCYVESWPKRKSRDAKRERSFDEGYSKNRIDIQNKHKFKKQVSNKVPSKFPKSSGDRHSHLSLKRERILIHQPRSKIVLSVERSIIVIFSCNSYWSIDGNDYTTVRPYDLNKSMIDNTGVKTF